MRLLWRATVFCALVPAFGADQVVTSTRDSVLTKAMSRPDARVYSSSEIGKLEGAGSRAVFTGLVVADPAQADKKIRGVRIEFSDAGWNRVAYVDEGKLQLLKDVVDGLAGDVERMGSRLASRGGEGYLGSCEMRDHPGAYPLHLDYCYAGWCSPALRITSPTLILFTGRTPADLSTILAGVIEYLKAH